MYAIWQDRFTPYKESGRVSFYENWDHDDLEKSALPRHSVLFIDDSCDLHPDKDFLRSFYTRDSHHLGVSIFCIFHQVYTPMHHTGTKIWLSVQTCDPPGVVT